MSIGLCVRDDRRITEANLTTGQPIIIIWAMSHERNVHTERATSTQTLKMISTTVNDVLVDVTCVAVRATKGRFFSSRGI